MYAAYKKHEFAIMLLVIASCIWTLGFVVGNKTADKPKPPICTAGASSVVLGHAPVTTYYPKGCVIYPRTVGNG